MRNFVRQPTSWHTVVLVAVFAALASPCLGADCTTCHPDKAEGKAVHPAVQMGCDSCHTTQHSTETYTFPEGAPAKGLMMEGADLCTACHDGSEFKKKTVHAPVAMGTCTSCHDPHVSKNEKLLKETPPSLCFQCHDQKMVEGKTTHPPAAEGNCTGCHSPHATDTDKLLLMDPPALCYMCHDQEKFRFAGSTHAPVAAGMCVACHDPHASEAASVLKKKIPVLCYDCHDKAMFESKYIHGPVAIGECLTCHGPHGGTAEKLLAAGGADLCFTCHERGIFERKNVHAPVSGGMCTTCHDPHSSPYGFQLRDRTNSLCGQCHPQISGGHVIAGFSGKSHPIGGRRDPKRLGRRLTCASCHDPHSSDSPRLFRYHATTPYGLCTHCHKM